ncbi:hypothetical protein NPIL_593581, partial [Nephila pilipes]
SYTILLPDFSAPLMPRSSASFMKSIPHIKLIIKIVSSRPFGLEKGMCGFVRVWDIACFLGLLAQIHICGNELYKTAPKWTSCKTAETHRFSLEFHVLH